MSRSTLKKTHPEILPPRRTAKPNRSRTERGIYPASLLPYWPTSSLTGPLSLLGVLRVLRLSPSFHISFWNRFGLSKTTLTHSAPAPYTSTNFIILENLPLVKARATRPWPQESNENMKQQTTASTKRKGENEIAGLASSPPGPRTSPAARFPTCRPLSRSHVLTLSRHSRIKTPKSTIPTVLFRFSMAILYRCSCRETAAGHPAAGPSCLPALNIGSSPGDPPRAASPEAALRKGTTCLSGLTYPSRQTNLNANPR